VSINDSILCIPLILSVPFLVRSYFPEPKHSTKFTALVTLGGLLWISYGLFSETLSDIIFGVIPEDAEGHEKFGRELANYMSLGWWDLVWQYTQVGNPLYQAYSGLVFFFTGASRNFMNVSNGWLGFWGGLVLASHLATDAVESKFRSAWLLGVIFLPSAIFWTTANLKEGFMYWAICMTIAGTLGKKHFGGPARSLLSVCGIIVGGLLRPQMMVSWLCAIFVTNLIHARKIGYSLIIIVMLIASTIGLQNKMGFESPQELLEIQEKTSKAMLTANRNSDIDFGSGQPIYFVTGFVSIFFRPFPFEAKNLRILLSCLETWGATFLICISWFTMNREQIRSAIKTADVQVALLAVLFFCFLLSEVPNEGLLVRQRLQAMPALIILAVWPMLRFPRPIERSLFNSHPVLNKWPRV
jgi:hypothetical protein